MGGEIIRFVAEQGPWVLIPTLTVIVGRSRPGREVGRVVAKEARWRYLRAKGYSSEELRQMVLADWADCPTATTADKEASG